MLTCFSQSTDHIRSSTGSCDPDHYIFRSNLVFLQFFPSPVYIVLCILYRIAKRFLPPSNQTNHQCGRHSESRRYFGGVKYSQTSAGSCTQIKDTPSLFHPGYDLQYQFFYLGYCFLNSRCNLLVFRIYIFQQLPD